MNLESATCSFKIGQEEEALTLANFSL